MAEIQYISPVRTENIIEIVTTIRHRTELVCIHLMDKINQHIITSEIGKNKFIYGTEQHKRKFL